MNSRVVLVGLASGERAIRGISNEPSAAGLAELARGAASFGDIITKDRLSPLHLISAGQAPTDRARYSRRAGMVANFDALARSYDHVVVDAGDATGPEVERVAEIAPHAVLVADSLANAATAAARERLLAAGFADVRILVGAYGSSRRDRSRSLTAAIASDRPARLSAIDPVRELAKIAARQRIVACV